MKFCPPALPYKCNLILRTCKPNLVQTILPKYLHNSNVERVVRMNIIEIIALALALAIQGLFKRNTKDQNIFSLFLGGGARG